MSPRDAPCRWPRFNRNLPRGQSVSRLAQGKAKRTRTVLNVNTHTYRSTSPHHHHQHCYRPFLFYSSIYIYSTLPCRIPNSIPLISYILSLSPPHTFRSMSMASLGMAATAARAFSARSVASVRSSAKSTAKSAQRSSRALRRLEGRNGTFGPPHAMSATAVRLTCEMVDRAEEVGLVGVVRASAPRGYVGTCKEERGC